MLRYHDINRFIVCELYMFFFGSLFRPSTLYFLYIHLYFIFVVLAHYCKRHLWCATIDFVCALKTVTPNAKDF